MDQNKKIKNKIKNTSIYYWNMSFKSDQIWSKQK